MRETTFVLTSQQLVIVLVVNLSGEKSARKLGVLHVERDTGQIEKCTQMSEVYIHRG